MQESLVAINVLVDDKVVNNKGVPLLYYWNGQTDVFTSLRTSKALTDFLQSKNIFNINNYGNAKIAYFYFTYVDKKENYKENVFNIQDIYEMPESLIFSYIKHYMNYLYKCSSKIDYQFDSSEAIINNEVNKIFKYIQDKHPNKISVDTVVKYVTSELFNTSHLSSKNVNVIINKLTNILNQN